MALVAVLAMIFVGACTGAKKPMARKSQLNTTSGGNLSGGTLPDGSPSPNTPGGQPGSPGAPGAGIGTGPGSGGRSSAGSTGGAPSGSSGAAGNSGGAAVGAGSAHSTLFKPSEDTIGITPSEIHLCAHAALTYGQAFNTSTSDLKVFFTALNAEKGGIFGRKVTIDYQNDNYDPSTAVQAAEACKAENPFMLLGGIGFDQIPAVRNWAEQNRMLYLYHTATVNGAAGKQFSYSELPSVEKMGEMFAELAASRHRTQRIGIVERDSANWSPGVSAFKAEAAKYNLKITVDDKVQANAGNYTQQVLDLNGHADVVWIWLNALEATEFIKQAHSQGYHPTFMVFPFNLTSQTLGADALNPKMEGVAMYTAYSNKDYSGPFAPYADDMKEFEREYATYDKNADLNGAGGDLLFLNWTAMKALAQQLMQCGQQCTRNRFVDLLNGYHAVPTSSACDTDFVRGDPFHVGGHDVDIMETYQAPNGKVDWRNTNTCIEHFPGIS